MRMQREKVFSGKCGLGLFGLTTILTIMLAMVALLGLGASAATMSGASGLIKNPSADTLNAGDIEFSFGLHNNNFTGSFGFGLLDNIEIGVNTLGTSGDFLNLGFFAKVNVVDEDETMPAIGVGTESKRTYVVASKRLMPRARGHIGYGFGSHDGIFGGVSVNLNTTSLQGSASMPPTTLIAEMVPGGTINAGVRVLFSPALSAELSLIDMRHLAATVSVRSRF